MIRRLAFIGAAIMGLLAIASPAIAAQSDMAFQHDRVQNPFMHTFLDVASVVIVLAPIATALLWGKGQNKWLLVGLIGIIQVPVAILAFSHEVSQAMRGSGLAVGLTITAVAIIISRRAAKIEAASAAVQEEPST